MQSYYAKVDPDYRLFKLHIMFEPRLALGSLVCIVTVETTSLFTTANDTIKSRLKLIQIVPGEAREKEKSPGKSNGFPAILNNRARSITPRV